MSTLADSQAMSWSPTESNRILHHVKVTTNHLSWRPYRSRGRARTCQHVVNSYAAHQMAFPGMAYPLGIEPSYPGLTDRRTHQKCKGYIVEPLVGIEPPDRITSAGSSQKTTNGEEPAGRWPAKRPSGCIEPTPRIELGHPRYEGGACTNMMRAMETGKGCRTWFFVCCHYTKAT